MAEQQRVQKAIQKGVHRILVRQLTVRFGSLEEVVGGRIREAMSEQLERWAEQMLVATRMEEVFDEYSRST